MIDPAAEMREYREVPRRPVLRWHGGKWLLAPWIIDHLPQHRVYVEPFGGAASVLLRKPRSYGEIYNDLDGDVVNLFRVLRSGRAAELIAAIRLTPFARAEFEASYEPTEDAVERARKLMVRSFQGFGSNGHNPAVRTWFRANSNRSGTPPAHNWQNYPTALEAIVERFSGVVVESRDAVDCMAQHDGPETLHYVDPPYMPETRSQKTRRGKTRYHVYQHEMTADEHRGLIRVLRGLAGMVVLSAYPSPLYDDALSGWHRVERSSFADGARPRTEVLWLNPRTAAALSSTDGPLFADRGSAGRRSADRRSAGAAE